MISSGAQITAVPTEGWMKRSLAQSRPAAQAYRERGRERVRERESKRERKGERESKRERVKER